MSQTETYSSTIFRQRRGRNKIGKPEPLTGTRKQLCESFHSPNVYQSMPLKRKHRQTTGKTLNA
eukprot:2260498-Amphidinium_carterae.1